MPAAWKTLPTWPETAVRVVMALPSFSIVASCKRSRSRSRSAHSITSPWLWHRSASSFPENRLIVTLIVSAGPRRGTAGEVAPKPDLYAAGELRTLPVIRLRRRDQQGSRHIPSGRSASSTDAFFARM